MRKGIEMSGKVGRGLAAALCVLGVGGASIPAFAGAQGPAGAEMTLVFASGKTRSVAGSVAVPVRCLGEGDRFCSGQVTLSRNGHHTSIPFSVRGGGEEVLFVPLRLAGGKGHPRKVHGVATTVQPLGPATRTQEFLYAG
ncbi:MAG: hypothetical protein JSU06_14185 [Actinobacteria bacterium]|nr:hypothetical protein [Actinomycetota bacterium]